MPILAPMQHRPGFRDAAVFAPGRVALLGDPALSEAAVLARNMAAGGFRGRLDAVGHPWPGMAHAPTVEALDGAPDLGVVALPPAAQPAAFAALVARGCFAALVPVPAPDLARDAREAGIRVLGQRSFGLALPGLGLNATLSHLRPRPGRLALLCQSSALARGVLDWAEGHDVGFSLILGIGGNADYGFGRALDWLARDTATGAVLLDLRRIKDRRRFVSAARAAAQTRPVVAVRPGGASGGVDGDEPGVTDAVLEAVLRRAGVLRVDGLEELLSAAGTLARVRPGALRGRAEADRIAVVSNGQGPGQMAADAAVRGGGRLAVIPQAARAMLDLALPDGWHGANPLVLPPGQGHRLAEAAAMLATLPEVGAVVAVHAPAPEEGGDTPAAAFFPLARGRGAPVLVGWLGQRTAGAQRLALAAAGLPVFATPEAAVRGALHLAQDRRNRVVAAELPPREVLELAPDRGAVRRILDAVRAEGRLSLTEAEALSVLDAYGLPTVPRAVARDAADAARAAMALGFPVALKALSPELPQKTAVGGVALGLRDVRAVRAEGAAILARVAAARPGLRLDGLLVQRQLGAGGPGPAAELRLRLGDDAMFGPWIGFGAGGTAASLLADEAVDLPPLNRTLARALIGRTRQARLLRGWRDRPAVDLDAVAGALVRLSALAVDFPEIAACGINPLLASPGGVVALDAELRLRPAGEAGALAVPPYPAELALPWTAPDGTALLLRPVRPEDAQAHGEAFRALDEADVRWRFFGPMRELSAAQTARLTQIDYDREMAFVAVQSRPGLPDRTVGVSRMVREAAGEAAEFAVVVVPEWKQRGLGGALMRRVLDWARDAGVRHVAGQVLADNLPMQGFVRRLGFALRRVDGETMEATLALE